MEIIKYPQRENWTELTKRPLSDWKALEALVAPVFDAVRIKGDEALKEFTLKFDGVSIENFAVSQREIAEAEKPLVSELKQAIQDAAVNIRKFHENQLKEDEIVETVSGVKCWRKSVAIEKVGLYIPGGSAPLFSTVLMLAIPAVIAGCGEIVLCSPPDKNGEIHPAILYAASAVGVKKIYKIGGAQAIAAMTFGTQSIPQVDKLFGPGNQYVTIAKQLSQQYGKAIDMPAGPSEVLVMSDETGNPAFIAADLLSQAEHGKDSQVIFLCTDENVLNKTMDKLQRQLAVLPRRKIAEVSIANSKSVLLNSFEEMMDFSNLYAPEHLIIMVKDLQKAESAVKNAGSVFLGPYTPEAAGDYASGTNHTLPTNGYARNYSGLSLDDFMKKITFQQISAQGIKNIGKTIEIMAEAEQLTAHKNAVSLRIKNEELRVELLMVNG